MALSLVNGFSVEEATSKYVYENLFPSIQHINGKGCIDKYTTQADVRSVNKIDVMRLRPVVPTVRQLGANNAGDYAALNGGYYNKYNVQNGGNLPQTVNYSISVDLFYDRIIPIPVAQLTANRTNFEQIVQMEVVDSMTWAINIVTYAKQLEAFFRVGDNFALNPAAGHAKGTIDASDITDDEYVNSLFVYGGATPAATAFTLANAKLSDGVPALGAFVVPDEGKQAFITPTFNAYMKSQYSTNASEAAAMINATGFINPFVQAETKRVDEKTGLCGLYDGVLLTRYTSSTMSLVYAYLGLYGTDTSGAKATVRGHLANIGCILVYGAGTCRGIAIPESIEVNKDPYNAQSVIVAPLLKMGVDVLHGSSIKIITSEGTAVLTKAEVALIINTIGFKACSDDGAEIRTAIGGTYDFNDGTTK